jgi:putative phage-type endonuclease
VKSIADFGALFAQNKAPNLAVNFGFHESGSEGWHALRDELGVIGGSEIAVILGLSPFESPYSLWAKKTGRMAKQETSDAMEWGNRLEPAILQKFADNHPGEVFNNCGTWGKKEIEFMRANPDGLLLTPEGEWVLVEVKTARDEAFWKDENGTLVVPPHYVAQVQWYLSVLELDRAVVAVLFGGSRYQEFEIIADDFEQRLAIDKAWPFHEYLVSEDEPPLSEPWLSTYEAIRYKHEDIDPDDEIELGELGREYQNHAALNAESTAELDRLKTEVLNAMGNAKRGLVNGAWAFSRQARKGGLPYLVAKRQA